MCTKSLHLLSMPVNLNVANGHDFLLSHGGHEGVLSYMLRRSTLWSCVTYWFSFVVVFCVCFLSLQSVIVKSVERNALNMYEARKCLLGLESSGVTIASNPSTVSCPVGLSCPGLDILSSAGLGLTGLGMCYSLYMALYFLMDRYLFETRFTSS